MLGVILGIAALRVFPLAVDGLHHDTEVGGGGNLRIAIAIDREER